MKDMSISSAGLEIRRDMGEKTSQRTIKLLNNRKAWSKRWSDDEMVKSGGGTAVEWIWKVFMEAWKSGHAPVDCTKAVIVPKYTV